MPFAEIGDARIFFEVHDATLPWAGTPETVIFHHGLGFDGRIWRPWLPLLAERYRLIAIDARGHGRSTVPGPGHPWSLDEFAEDVLAVADAAGTDHFHLVGESMGGAVTYHAAAVHRQRVLSATAIAAPHMGGRIGNEVDDWSETIERAGMDGWSEMMLRARFHPGAMPQPALDWLHEMQRHSVAHVAIEVSTRVLRRMDLQKELTAGVAPLLLIVGDASPFVSVDALQELRRIVPQAELQVMAGARHGVVLSHAHECARAFRSFADRCNATRDFRNRQLP